MPSLIKLERDRITSELQSVRRLLTELDDEDVMSRFGLEDRESDLIEELTALDLQVDRNAALGLFFGGKPVLGQRGIEAGFAATAVASFQDLVSKIMAKELIGLGERGPIPQRQSSTMHITNVVRGSFGFQLEEMNDQGAIVETALEQAVERAGKLLVAFTTEDESEFEEAVGETDERIVHVVRDIFRHLHQSDATFRYVTADIDHSFSHPSVDLALQRALTTELQEEPVGITGSFGGFLPEGHMFEFQEENGPLIRGRIAREVTAAEIAEWNQTLLGIGVYARFMRTSVLKDGEVTRQKFKLLGISSSLLDSDVE